MPKFKPGDLVRFRNDKNRSLWSGQLCIVLSSDNQFTNIRRLSDGGEGMFYTFRLNPPEEEADA